ncbi:MAG: endonuclease/exonuclease/phosphatase, partial [Pirellulaceae bacterium]|nr:endonuclease/exonuclease/phosphatase [Pirellulaceae bacterium]
TFSLVNVHTEPEELQYELSWLDDVFRRVRDDGRGEDDVIMLGNFNASDRSLGELKHVPGMHAVIHEMATNTQGTGQFDNILFSLPATSEYSGRGGVYDFYNRFDMTMDEALRISNHLPVWAEFNPIEGGADGVVLSASREQL